MPFDETTLVEDLDQTETAAETVTETTPSLLPIYAGLVLFMAVMAASVFTFGLPGLYLPAVAFVPIMFILLIRITLG